MSTALAVSKDLDDEAILGLWSDIADAAGRHRLSARELAQKRLRLGELLAQKRAELSVPGALGQFDAWLRSHRRSRATAYRLIHAWERQGCCLTDTTPPAVHLRRQTLTLRLECRDAVFFHRALACLALQSHPTDLPFLFSRLLLSHLPRSERRQFDSLLDTPPSRFTPADLATLPPLKFAPGLRPIVITPPKSSSSLQVTPHLP